jgi:hypothetical protein
MRQVTSTDNLKGCGSIAQGSGDVQRITGFGTIAPQRLGNRHLSQ